MNSGFTLCKLCSGKRKIIGVTGMPLACPECTTIIIDDPAMKPAKRGPKPKKLEESANG